LRNQGFFALCALAPSSLEIVEELDEVSQPFLFVEILFRAKQYSRF
jgi:hypothetical protein